MRILTTIILIAAAAPNAWAAEGAAAAYQRSYDLELAQDYRGALEAIGTLPAGEKKTYTHQLRRAWLSYLAADYPGAIESYAAAVKLEPHAIEPLLGLSLPQMAMRRWLDAKKTLEATLTRAPTNYLALSRLAFTLFNLGRFAEAEETYRLTLKLFPADVEMQAGLGYALLRQGKKKDAERVFSRVLTVAPRHVTAGAGLRASRL